MSDYEIRRMDLKSQMLSIEFAKLDEQSKEVAATLRKRQQKINEASANWSEYLKKTIIAYRNADPMIKNQFLGSKLNELANANQVINKQKNEQNKLVNNLNRLVLARKQKNAHLNHCRTIKNKKKEAKVQVTAQNLQDEFVSIKFASQKHGSYKNESISNVIDEKENTVSSTLDNTNDKNVKLREGTSTLASCQNAIIIINSNSQINEAIHVTNANIDLGNPGQSKNESKYNPNMMQQKWTDATELHEQRLKQNQKVSVSILQTSEGEAVCLDYLAGPGRILSVAGHQTSNTDSIELSLKATASADKVNFKKEQLTLLDDLRSRGLKIRSFEILP